MSKELNALSEIKNELDGIYGCPPRYPEELKEHIETVEKALTPPTADEVCDALNKLWKFDKKPHTTLHFTYDKLSKEFKMVDENNIEYRYISVNRWSDNAISLVDLDLETLSLLGRFYEGLEN